LNPNSATSLAASCLKKYFLFEKYPKVMPKYLKHNVGQACTTYGPQKLSMCSSKAKISCFLIVCLIETPLEKVKNMLFSALGD